MMNTTTKSAQQIQAAQRRTIPAEEQATPAAPPPLPAERFGLAVGRIMHQFRIVELPVVTGAGTEVGTLQLSTASYMGYTMTAIAWRRVEESEIEQDIYDVEMHDLPLTSGVFGSWDSGGLERLDAHRTEITNALVSAVAAQHDHGNATP